MSPVTATSATRAFRCATFVLLLIVSAGCQLLPGDASAQQRAQQVLDQWDRVMASAGPDAVVFANGLSAGGGWNGNNAENDKEAFLAGQLFASPTLPSGQPQPDTVVWPDGSTQSVELISASQALDGLIASAGGGKCNACQPVQITGAELRRQDWPTSRGQANLPTWQFEFAAADEPIDPITFVAVKDAVSVANGSFSGSSSAGHFLDAAYGNSNSTSLTVSFTGSPYRGDNPCGADYAGQAVESERAVAIIITESHRVAPIGACTAVGATRTAVVDMSRPLGNRAVLDVSTGTPVELKDEAPPTDQIPN